jgi:hypothetical protein
MDRIQSKITFGVVAKPSLFYIGPTNVDGTERKSVNDSLAVQFVI